MTGIFICMQMTKLFVAVSDSICVELPAILLSKIRQKRENIQLRQYYRRKDKENVANSDYKYPVINHDFLVIFYRIRMITQTCFFPLISGW